MLIKDRVKNYKSDKIETAGGSDAFMTAQEVAAFLKVNLGSVRRWSRNGKLKGYRLGGTGDWRYIRSDVIDFVRGGEGIEE